MASDFYSSCIEGCDARYSDDPYARKRCFEWCNEVLDKYLEYQYQRAVEGGVSQSSAAISGGPPRRCEVKAGDLAVLEYVIMKKKYALGVTALNFVSYMVDAVRSYLEEARREGCAVDEALKRHIANRIAAIFKEYGLDVKAEAVSDLHGLPKDVKEILEMLIGAAPQEATSSPPELECDLSAGDRDVLEYIAKKKRSYVTPLTFTSHMTSAIRSYLEEAKDRGCIVDETLKRLIADRIREIFRDNGLDVSAETASDLHGTPQDVVDVLKLLGVVKKAAPYRRAQKPPLSKPTRYQGDATKERPPHVKPTYVYREPIKRRRAATALLLAVILGLVAGGLYNLYQPTRSTAYIISTSMMPIGSVVYTIPYTTVAPIVPTAISITLPTVSTASSVSPPPTVTTQQEGTSTSTAQKAPIDSRWVQQFIDLVNQYRARQGAPPLQHCPWLDKFAQVRFATLQTNIAISHYGFDEDFDRYLGIYRPYLLAGEEGLHPEGYTPNDYVRHLQADAPIHWEGFLNVKFRYYGYYIGYGHDYVVIGFCPVTEIPGPDINIPQYYQAHGCRYTIKDVTWFVVEMVNYCDRVSYWPYRVEPVVLDPQYYLYEVLNVSTYMLNPTLDVAVQSTYPVKVLLMTPNQYSYWKSLSSQQAMAYNGLYSAYGTYVTINYQLSPGVYYLVVYNANSQTTTVTVTGNITFEISPKIP